MENHTFVIPAYRESIYLEDCIKSLYNQSVKSQLIITTSTPATYTENIAEKYNIPYIINESGQKGIASDWNFALHAAKTQFVTIAHQDDIYEANYTEALLKKISTADDVVIAFTSYTDLVNNRERKLSVNAFVKSSLLFPFFFSNILRKPFFKKMILLFGNPVCCPSVIYNMLLLNKFEFSQQHKYTLDWYAWYELTKRKGSFIYVNKKLVKHRIHPDSETTAQLNNGSRKEEEFKFFEMMWGKRMARLLSPIYRLGHKDNELPR